MQIDTTYIMSAAVQEGYLDEITPSEKSNYDFLNSLYDIPNSYIWIILVAIAILFFLAIIIKRLVDVGELPDVPDAQGGLGNDSIFGHKWEEEINAALNAQNYGDAAVLCYLHWLSWLNENGIVSYHKSKTPGIYLSETQQCTVTTTDLEQMQKTEIIDKTSTLTNTYLRVRYGHKNISEEEARQLIAL